MNSDLDGGTDWIRRTAAVYLAAQGLGGLAWWVALGAWPRIRGYFLLPGAPFETLLAFAPADLLLYAALSMICAYGVALRRKWSWPLLCAASGASAYAALYALTVPLIGRGAGWAGALLMAPSLVLPAWFAWRLREAPDR